MSWHVIGASVQGTSHQAGETPCQDAHCLRQLPSGEWLIAIADGAGSASRSAEGAQLAVDRAITALEEALSAAQPADENAWRAMMAAVFTSARAEIVKLAEHASAPLRDFATTLLCAVVGGDRLVVAQVGDGLAVTRDGAGQMVCAAHPQRGEYANEAAFITMLQAAEYVETQVFDGAIDAAAFSTDGLLRLALKLPAYAPHAPFFTPLFDFAAAATDEALAQQQLADFLGSPRVCARTDDDKTLVLAVRAITAV
ncbi:MAG: protein phosphatase 2C domain-containing protein [Chloroflexi bacterium]|nr:protein phosphatase 2C domain-containing protein [Chloroflexota bacterium]MCL5273506.1 protein phosphatase 2C domain-containing protein [Chloroflexota bacterium]